GPIKGSIDNVGNISIGSKRIQQSRADCKSHQSIADLKVLIILCDAVQQRSQLAIRFKAEQVSLLREQLIIQSIRNCAGSGVVINRGNDGSGGRAVVTTSGQHADSHDASEHQRSNFLEFHNEFSSLWCIKDRDPKQVERKVLSFQRHYSIPPPRCQGPIYYFLVFAFFSLLWVEV